MLSVLGWLFTMFVGLTFARYDNGNFPVTFAVGASLVMGVGTLMLVLMPERSRLWSSILIATSVVYWTELFAALGDEGLVWGLLGPVYTLVGGMLGLISKPVQDAPVVGESRPNQRYTKNARPVLLTRASTYSILLTRRSTLEHPTRTGTPPRTLTPQTVGSDLSRVDIAEIATVAFYYDHGLTKPFAPNSETSCATVCSRAHRPTTAAASPKARSCSIARSTIRASSRFSASSNSA